MIEVCQPVHHFFRVVINISHFIIYIVSSGNSNLFCNFFLHQAHVMAAPAQAVRNILYFLIAVILLIKLLGFQELTGSDQPECMDTQRSVPYNAVFCSAHEIIFIGKLRKYPPMGLQSLLGDFFRK